MERRIPYRRGFKQPQFCTKRCRTKTERNRKVSTPFHRGLEHTKNGKACKSCAMEALQERGVCTEERETQQQQQQRTQERVPCSLQSLRYEGACLPSKPTYQVRQSLSRPDRPHIKLRYQVRGFPWGVLARNRAADRHVVSCATVRGVQPVIWLCLSVTTVTGSGLALEGICGGGNFNHGQFLLWGWPCLLMLWVKAFCVDFLKK
jgi:hypothetical protein